MNFLISIIVTIILVAFGGNFIKKHDNFCYLLTTLLSILLVIGSYTGVIWTMSPWFTSTILPILIKNAFATAIFVIVMYTGAFKNGGKLIKFLMPIRAQLSIIACILTLAHNISFGKYYFVSLFTAPKTIPTNMKAAAVVSIILIVIMIPLFITSFPSVRKSMKPKTWKKLQRNAYLFYGLIYLHVMLIMIPLAFTGNSTYIINVVIYSIVFLTYAIMRVNKYMIKKSSVKLRQVV
ncbi:hypothetical protein [Terrisporobacter sp.]